MKSQAPKGPNIMSITPAAAVESVPLQCEANGYAGIFEGQLKDMAAVSKKAAIKRRIGEEGCNAQS